VLIIFVIKNSGWSRPVETRLHKESHQYHCHQQRGMIIGRRKKTLNEFNQDHCHEQRHIIIGRRKKTPMKVNWIIVIKTGE
jgi:hypothetical protein